MSNKAKNFGTVKNLREWFDSALTGNNYLFCVDQQCLNVDLIWDGTNYHIAYEDENGIKYVQPFTYTDERVWSIKEVEETSN